MDSIAIPQPLGRPRQRPLRLPGDKGYSYRSVRQWLRAHGIEPVTPQRKDQLANHKGRPLKFDKATYRRRSIIERCVGRLKECRRIGTRFEKLAISFLTMLKLAMIQRYINLAFPKRASSGPTLCPCPTDARLVGCRRLSALNVIRCVTFAVLVHRSTLERNVPRRTWRAMVGWRRVPSSRNAMEARKARHRNVIQGETSCVRLPSPNSLRSIR